jgi:hypothetical protein
MKVSMKLRKEVSHGGSIPRGWRLAWYEPKRRVGVYYPSPLHWVVRTTRELSWRLRTALHAPPIERAQVFEMQRSHREREKLAEEYSRGYLIGWRACYHECLVAVEEELTRSDRVWEIGELFTETPKISREN